jgi:uncharacterized protein (TIGR02444 family)
MAKPYEDFRRFALDVYRSEGVSPATLLLQDRSGVDVNVLLLAAFVGAARGLSFTSQDCETVGSRTRPWQNEVVGPLRALRLRLKNGPPPAPSAATAELRDRVKTLELDAEMIELDELAALAVTLAGPAAPGDADERAMAAIHVVVHDATGREPNDDECAAIALIASAAARFGKE